ncbi:hypothetical protein MIB92_19620 [Aestuariirhabdus sp. Z084]|uniref:hypothetical protein n=1 Tax=Aestuariirhabdus haliotis TaxID=2918751 RepID=UPI00201B3947|nr:hypothetical protein [Aestuariirhabdus haliotis]MCL6417867.1 hypothetical protein [Aestuariirhabdus haliotis]MCL6421751.1 hypothetical protein [Aestuariirhabdus haliotis]
MSDNLFIGASQELSLASKLTSEGIIVSTPLVDIGVDLIASNKDFSNSIPIQVKYKSREKNIFFTGKEIDSYSSKNVYIAYYLAKDSWFMPFDKFLQLAERPENRKDRAGYIKLKDKADNLDQYKNEQGFSLMLEAIKNA